MTFNEINVNCDKNDALSVHNEDHSFMIFDYCSSIKNDTSLGNFVIAKGKYLLLRMQTFSDRTISTTFDMFLFDDSSLADVSPNPPVLTLTQPTQPPTTTLSPNRGIFYSLLINHI